MRTQIIKMHGNPKSCESKQKMNRRLAPRRGIHTDTDAGAMRSHVLRDIDALSDESLSGFTSSIAQAEEKNNLSAKIFLR